VCKAAIERLACDASMYGGTAEECHAILTGVEVSSTVALHRLVCVASDPFFARTCTDPERLQRELDKAAASSRIDLRNAATRARRALIVGDKTTVYLSLLDIDPPCAHLFDYTQP